MRLLCSHRYGGEWYLDCDTYTCTVPKYINLYNTLALHTFYTSYVLANGVCVFCILVSYFVQAFTYIFVRLSVCFHDVLSSSSHVERFISLIAGLGPLHVWIIVLVINYVLWPIGMLHTVQIQTILWRYGKTLVKCIVSAEKKRIMVGH